MRRSAKILAATIAVTAAAAAGVLLARQGRDPVVETQPRFTASVSAKQNSVPAQSRISLQPNTYLEPMAEPKPSAAAVTKQIPEPAKPAEPAAEPVPALAPPLVCKIRNGWDATFLPGAYYEIAKDVRESGASEYVLHFLGRDYRITVAH